MIRTSSTPSTLSDRAARLPQLRHGVRWTVTPGEQPYRVRATRQDANKLRVFDVATHRPVLKVTNRPGSTLLPSTAVLYALLAWTDPNLKSDLTAGLGGLCWILNETAAGTFDVALRLRGPRNVNAPRVSAKRLPLPLSDRAGARDVARALLHLAQVMSADTADLDEHTLAALRQSLDSDRRS